MFFTEHVVLLTAAIVTCYGNDLLTQFVPRQLPESCPGYRVSHIITSPSGLTAELELADTACNLYGLDVARLTLEVGAESGKLKQFRYNR